MISGDGATDDIVEVIANSTNSPQFINLGAAGAGILRYVGHYYTKDRINFISVNGVPTATELKLDINSYNRNTNVFETTSLITITETNFNIAPQVGQGYQFALAESANLISIGYMVDESTIVTIDFNKNEINNTNYLVSKWSV
jgi:hypothetical protein